MKTTFTKKICLLFVFVFSVAMAFAQGEANIWYFGLNAGLDFNTGSPVALLDGQINSPEGSAVMSTADGQLLFYTDGVTVWNRNHVILLNGSNLLGERSSSQAALIVPKPGSSTIYYIFTTEASEESNFPFTIYDHKLAYSEVDMSLDGGLGGITAIKNIVLYFPSAEKLTAIKHANNIDIWVIAHDAYTNKYLTYGITNSGVNHIPLVYEEGTIPVFNINLNNFPSTIGCIKASPDGTKIAAAYTREHKIDVLNFNKATGALTFLYTIENLVQRAYGVEFSPNGKLLYATGSMPPALWQFNITPTNLNEVLASAVSIPINRPYRPFGMQVGPDKKIYISTLINISCIQQPDNIGLQCDYNPNSIEFEGTTTTRVGLPNFFPYYFNPEITVAGMCLGDSTFFSAFYGLLADSVHWNFGDLPSSASIQAEGIQTFHVYNQEGVYNVTALLFSGSNVDTINVTAFIISPPNINLGIDLTICPGDTIILNTGTVQPLIWQDGTNAAIYPVSSPGVYYATVSNSCGTATDTVRVTWRPAVTETIAFSDCEPFTFNGITYDTTGQYNQFLLNTSGCDSIIMINFERLFSTMAALNFETCEPTTINGITYAQPGTYNQLLINNLGCDSTLTINLDILNLNAQIFQSDSLLFVNGTPTAVQWINCATGQAIAGATQTSFIPQATGNYGAVITVGECVDTSNCRQIIISTTPSKTITLCESIVISPNPTTGKIEFSFDKSSYNIQLFTATGALLYRGTGFAGTQQLDLSSLAPALYVLKVDECSFKLVKQ